MIHEPHSRISRRSLGRLMFGVAAAGLLGAAPESDAADSPPPAPVEDTANLALLEQRRGKPLAEEEAQAIRVSLNSLNTAWKNSPFIVPDGTEPAFVFTPAPLRKPKSHGR